MKDDVRWRYGIPPSGNANYAWIQHYLYHLSPRGIAGIVMSNGSLSTNTKEEKVIREGIINDDKLDCVIMLPGKLFTNTPIAACIWVLTNSKTDSRFRNRIGETLFIDCRDMGTLVSRKLRELSIGEIEEIASTYQNWRSKNEFEHYVDTLGYCKSVAVSEISEHNYIIVPGRYVGVPPLPIDKEGFETRMNKLVKELSSTLSESESIKNEIKSNLGGIGFDL